MGFHEPSYMKKYRLIDIKDGEEGNLRLQVKRWYGWSTFRFLYYDMLDKKYKNTISDAEMIINKLNEI